MAKDDIKDFQFEKGKSGNPKGKPKGIRNRSTILKELLDLNDNELKMHMAQIKKAIESSDTSAYNAVLDSAYGKPQQQTDITTNGESIKENITPISFVKSNDDKDK
jgi:hypothetical protein